MRGAPSFGGGALAALVQRSALLALAAAAAGVGSRALVLGVPAAGLLGQLALAGAASATLALAGLAFAPAPRRRDEPRAGGSALALGLGWALVPWALLAHGLLVSTHHRPLGAVTFAGAAFGIALVLVVAARRLLAAPGAGARPARRGRHRRDDAALSRGA